MSSSPPGDALRALAVVLAPFLVPLLSGAGAPRPFTQRDGERPPGAGRIKYLRAHRRALEAGDAGAWSEGRARLMTAEAWARWSRTSSRREAIAEAPTKEPSILDELGARRVSK